MNLFKISILAGLEVLCLAVSSCGELNKPLARSGMLIEPPTRADEFGVARRPKFHRMHIIAATAEQRKSAELSAKKALKSSTVINQVKKEKVQYLAVPVKPSKTQKERGTPVMKVNIATGVSTDEVFVKDEGGYKPGEKVKLGGDYTLYFATTGDKI